jgi:drug/metabolite transporter (DMT)-like permease
MIIMGNLYAIFLIIFGCVVILKKDSLGKIVEFVKTGNNMYVISAINIIMGLDYLKISIVSRMIWIVFFFGVIILLKGIFPFVVKKKKAVEIIDELFGDPTPSSAKFIGACCIVVGALLICAI